MALTEQQIKEGLSYVTEPDLKVNLVEGNLIQSINVNGDKARVVVQVKNPAMHNRKRVQEACEHYLKQHVGSEYTYDVEVVAMPKEEEQTAEPEGEALSEVKQVIAIASGKGGVGKSTITANLATSLAKQGYRVGLIDADIYGPSAPMMFDVIYEKPEVSEINGKRYMLPVETAYGVKVMSIGFFADPDQAVVWRGPMASKALEQMFTDVFWGDLDYMLIDLPPGTGDIHLTLVKQAPLTGAIVVSTPQPVALADAQKGIAMFRLDSINVPVIGLVENMSFFIPEDMPDKKYFIFGKDGAKNLAQKMNTPLLGQIPLIQGIREAGDAGRPAAMQEDTPASLAFEEFAQKVIALKPIPVPEQ
mgnify:CR=1 FL=1